MSDILELTRVSQRVVKKLRDRKEELDIERGLIDTQIKTIEKMLGVLTPDDPIPNANHREEEE